MKGIVLFLRKNIDVLLRISSSIFWAILVILLGYSVFIKILIPAFSEVLGSPVIIKDIGGLHIAIYPILGYVILSTFTILTVRIFKKIDKDENNIVNILFIGLTRSMIVSIIFGVLIGMLATFGGGMIAKMISLSVYLLYPVLFLGFGISLIYAIVLEF